MAEIVMHESSEDYAEWAHGECLRLEKENGILRGLLFKARIELKKHNPQCAEMLKELTPNAEVRGCPHNEQEQER